MRKSSRSSWQLWIDTGGTFTDCVARDPAGQLHRAKVLSSSTLRGTLLEQKGPKNFRIAEKWGAPKDFIRGFRFRVLDYAHPESSVESYDPASGHLLLEEPLTLSVADNAAFEVCSPYEAPILGARLVTQTIATEPLPAIAMRLATTRGTNALLERKGSNVALFITEGFADLLRIGNQQRPDIFALEILKPEPLYRAVMEVEGRVAADGTVLTELNLGSLAEQIEHLLENDIRVAAVALMHSYVHSEHERKLTAWLEEKGFQHISCSSDLAPFIRIVPRAATTVVDAYLAPVINSYLRRVTSQLPDGALHVMTSAGGLIKAQDFRAKDCLLSGPAGGVVGAASAGKRSGFQKIIAFDMGGTSTDVARFDGDYEYVFEHEVGEAHLVATALAIESVAAGGGSICSYDGFRLKVGPESASAHPGPACYGAGGPLTVTDVNLLLGRLDPTGFEIPIVSHRAESRLAELIQQIERQTRKADNRDALLQGFLDIANERMADAIRRVSVRKGYDPEEYALVAFGGAGGQHACAIAERLGIRTVLIPQDASLLSAHGLGHALIERIAERQILQPLSEVVGEIPAWFEALSAEARNAVASEGISKSDIEVRRRIINLRFMGQDSILSIEMPKDQTVEDAFRAKHQQIFGHLPEGRQIEVESLRAVCSSGRSNETPTERVPKSEVAEPEKLARACFKGNWQEVPCFSRQHLHAGQTLTGPALIFEPHSAVVVEAGWGCEVDAEKTLLVKQEQS